MSPRPRRATARAGPRILCPACKKRWTPDWTSPLVKCPRCSRRILALLEPVGPWGLFDRKPKRLRAARMPKGAPLVVTREGAVMAAAGDWLLVGLAGELYPVGRELFRRLYMRAKP